MRRRRAQALPILAGIILLLVTVSFSMLDLFMYGSNAGQASRAAVRAAGLAAIQQIDPAAGYERPYLSPEAATATARTYLALNLVGDAAQAPFDYLPLFESGLDLGAAVLSVDGTLGDSVDGVDVEIINPAVLAGQTGERYLNCDPAEGCADLFDIGDLCTDEGIYPQGITSALDGGCYTTAAVVFRVRLHANHLTPLGQTISFAAAIRMGTDE